MSHPNQDAADVLAAYDELAMTLGWVDVTPDDVIPFGRPMPFFHWLSTRDPEALQQLDARDVPARLLQARAVYDAELAAKPYDERN